MNRCKFPTFAARVEPRTLSMITALNGGVKPEIKDNSTYFMIYCFGSDHEEKEIIDEETYARTYEALPENVAAMFVDTID